MGSSPQPAPVVAPPVVNQDVVNREADDLAQRRRGRAAQMLAGDTTGAPASAVSVKTLLGN